MTLIQVGGVLAFFTLRSIPEVCGSNYAVDYLVMLPAVLYVHVLWCHLNKRLAQGPMPCRLSSRPRNSGVLGRCRADAPSLRETRKEH